MLSVVVIEGWGAGSEVGGEGWVVADSSIIGPIFSRDILETLSSTNQMKAFRADA